jgi:hypothetical protein
VADKLSTTGPADGFLSSSALQPHPYYTILYIKNNLGVVQQVVLGRHLHHLRHLHNYAQQLLY